MPDRRRYANPPIVEAVVDIKFAVSHSISRGTMIKAVERLSGTWAPPSDIVYATAVFQAGAAVSASATQQAVGVRVDSTDKLWVVQFQSQGLGVSRLEPYASWENLRDTTKDIWQALELDSVFVAPTRIALRTVNRLEFPLPVLDFKTYLRTYPELSPDMPQLLSSFFSQLAVPDVAPQISANIIQATVPATKPDHVAMALDIDVYQTSEFPDSTSGMWDRFEILHAHRNSIFEACITDATRDLFK
jgi:uncharacterized protein (TIGR04255 family)